MGPLTAQAVRYKRTQAGLSARALSLRAGLSPAYVSKLESGQLEPSLATFARIALELGLSPTEVWVCVASECRSASTTSRGTAAASVLTM